MYAQRQQGSRASRRTSPWPTRPLPPAPSPGDAAGADALGGTTPPPPPLYVDPRRDSDFNAVAADDGAVPVKLETNAAGDANAGGAVNVPEKLAEKGGAVKPPPPPLPLPLPGLLAAAKAAANGDVENEPVNAAAENAGLALAALSPDVAVADPNVAKDGAAGAVGCEEPPTLAFGASLDARASFTGAATGLAASVGELAAFLVGATAAVASPSLSSATATSSARFLDAATSSVALCTGKAAPQENTFTQSRDRMQRGGQR